MVHLLWNNAEQFKKKNIDKWNDLNESSENYAEWKEIIQKATY